MGVTQSRLQLGAGSVSGLNLTISNAPLTRLAQVSLIMCLCVSPVQGLSPATVPSWQRVRAANLLAADGRTWVDVFKRHNSGTYNNQYMVVDLKRFQPRKQLQSGLLWVVEQLPGMVEAADMTNTLSRGYCKLQELGSRANLQTTRFLPTANMHTASPDDALLWTAALQVKLCWTVDLICVRVYCCCCRCCTFVYLCRAVIQCCLLPQDLQGCWLSQHP